MKPKIDDSSFGKITIEGKCLENDVIIRLNRKVEKRKKKLSKQVYGTSHVISLAEAEFVFEKGAERLVVGSGQSGMVKLSPEAQQYFKQQGCVVELLPTPEALRRWNEAQGKLIGLFHVTC